jgi:hypothetical protein
LQPWWSWRRRTGGCTRCWRAAGGWWCTTCWAAAGRSWSSGIKWSTWRWVGGGRAQVLLLP